MVSALLEQNVVSIISDRKSVVVTYNTINIHMGDTYNYIHIYNSKIYSAINTK